MLTENDVVAAVARHLEQSGWTITSSCSTAERGEDLVAVRDGERLVVEAKGAGSSKSDSNRFGSEFSNSQVFTHVAKAILKALRVVSLGTARGAVALPGNRLHRRAVELVAPALRSIGVVVFWVADNGAVEVEGSL